MDTWDMGPRNAHSFRADNLSLGPYRRNHDCLMNLLVFVDHVRRDVKKKTRGHLPARQIFRSISANGVRAKVMLNLLGQFIGNYQKDKLYDKAISEFQSLVNLRNDYLHGLWWTKDDGNVYLQTENLNEFSFNRKKHIPEKDFTTFIKRAVALEPLVREITQKEYNLSQAKKEADARRASAP
jgi:hypothetical protein